MTPEDQVKYIDRIREKLESSQAEAEQILCDIVYTDLGPCRDVVDGGCSDLQVHHDRTMTCNLWESGCNPLDCPRVYRILKEKVEDRILIEEDENETSRCKD